MGSIELREAAQQVLEALELAQTDVHWELNSPTRKFLRKAEKNLRAALAEPTTEDSSAVETVQERNFCPRCGKRTNDIHTCTPPHEERFCDTHCTWADHAPGCVRAEPVQEPVSVTDLQQALVETNLIDPDAIDDPEGYDDGSTVAQIDALHGMLFKPQRPAEPVQEPVAWRFQSALGGWAYGSQPPLGSKYPVYPLYTAPPQRKPLTEEEIEKAYREIWRDLPSDFDHTSAGWIEMGIRYAERAHGIGGQP